MRKLIQEYTSEDIEFEDKKEWDIDQAIQYFTDAKAKGATTIDLSTSGYDGDVTITIYTFKIREQTEEEEKKEREERMKYSPFNFIYNKRTGFDLTKPFKKK